MRFCLRRISIDTVSPFSYERRIRIACEGFAGFRPPMDVITSPPFSGRLESAGAFTTSTPSLVPKYSSLPLKGGDVITSIGVETHELEITPRRSEHLEVIHTEHGAMAIPGGPGI